MFIQCILQFNLDFGSFRALCICCSCQLNVKWLCVTASWWKIFLLSWSFGCVVYVHCNRFSTLSLFLQAAPPGHHPRGQGLHQNDDRAVQEHRLPQHTEWPETGMTELPLRRTSNRKYCYHPPHPLCLCSPPLHSVYLLYLDSPFHQVVALIKTNALQCVCHHISGK